MPSNNKKFFAGLTKTDILAMISYMGPLVLIPIFTARTRYVLYHANQGAVLAILAVAYWLATTLLSNIFVAIWWPLWRVFSILTIAGWLAALGLAIVGMINAYNRKCRPLPYIGKLFKVINY